MKAAAYHRTGPPDVFEYLDVPDPECRSSGVVIRVEAVSIEGGDVLNRAGGMLTGDPHIVGYQCAGTVVEVGESAAAAGAAEGQRVVVTMANGSHAELVSVPYASVWPVPDGADIVAAACVPVAFGTADDCLFEFGKLVGGETVLVQAGAGGVGIAAIQLAKRAGATVLATASSADKLERIGHLGVDHGINYKEHNAAEEARRLTDGRGVDLVVDPVGGSTLQGSLGALANRGRAITVGNAGRERIAIDASPLMGINGSLTGVFLGAEIATPRVREMIGRHIADVASGDLEVIVDRTFPLADAAAAHAYIESRAAVGRVVLIP
ncbi:MAG TPA: zinc-binding alcohol dehydrogenase family protein [Acidimicrobiales bacterium]|nr:zinc-binding alcohol dehydrogenase family protein [Acidimicrobiales bacterium]